MKKSLNFLITTILTISFIISASASAAEMDYSVLVEPKYDDALTLNDGFIAVKIGDKWGYVNENGEEIITPQYDWCASFNEGKAIVGTLDPEYQSIYELGFVDSNGKYTPFKGIGGEIAKTDSYNLFDSNGDSYRYGFLNGYFGIDTQTPEGFYYHTMFDTTGNYVADNVVNKKFAGHNDGVISGVYSDGLFCVFPEELALDPCGFYFCDKNKNMVLEFPSDIPDGKNGNYTFLYVSPFVNGYAYAWVREAGDESSTEKLVFLNREGKIIINGNYSTFFGQILGNTEYLYPFTSGVCIVKDDTSGKYGALNTKGEIVIPFDYEDLSIFMEGLAVAKKDGLNGYIDIKNNYIIDPQFEQATNFYNGLAIVKKDDSVYIIDRYGNKFSGSENIPIDSYISESGLISSPDDVIIIKKNEKYGLAKLNYALSKPLETEVSAWAYTEVIEAIENNLVPMYLQNQYFENIKRNEFAELIIQAIEEVTGKDKYDILKEKCNMTKVDMYDSNKFADTTSENILIANKLGIINGVSETAFAPENQISRQDAAALLMRAAKFCSNGEEIAVSKSDFKDDSSISDYAKNAVSYVTTLKIMKGVEDNNFDPTATYTREQAYVTIVRLFNSLKN